MQKTHCDKPDRDEPRLKCGYPLPCPHHTAIITGDAEQTAVAVPPALDLYEEQVSAMLDIGDAVLGEDDTCPCPMCNGPGGSMGFLGSKQCYRCRNCGWTFSP